MVFTVNILRKNVLQTVNGECNNKHNQKQEYFMYLRCINKQLLLENYFLISYDFIIIT